MFYKSWVSIIIVFLFINIPVRADENTIEIERFGLTSSQLSNHVKKTELLILKCMDEAGFQYVAADYRTIRKGMLANKKHPGLSEGEFIEKYGFGLSTLYTGKPPQLENGYSPAKSGLDKRSIQIYSELSPTEQIGYNRALFGENLGATFAVALETENLSFCGGCTLKAVQKVFKPEQLKASYDNPENALINKDPRMKYALQLYAEEMRKAGFDYQHPDDVELDIRNRVAALTKGSTISITKMSRTQLAGLKELQDYEKKVAIINFKLYKKIYKPVELKIKEELHPKE